MIRYETITSRQSVTVKNACALKEKKTRDKLGLFYFEGHKLLIEAQKSHVPVISLFVTQTAAERHQTLLIQIQEEYPDCTFFAVTDEVYQKLSQEKAPEGLFCIAERLDKSEKNTTIYNNTHQNVPSFPVTDRHERILICECLQNPGNLGTVLRTANAFGYDRVILSADCADVYSEKVIRAAMGATFCMQTETVTDIPGIITVLRQAGYPVAAAALTKNAVSLAAYTHTADAVFVIGSEGTGLRAETIAACDCAVLIPMGTKSESLNAAVAATVLMWEQYRQAEKTD